jgi:hypothetical protein
MANSYKIFISVTEAESIKILIRGSYQIMKEDFAKENTRIVGLHQM